MMYARAVGRRALGLTILPASLNVSVCFTLFAPSLKTGTMPIP